MWARYVWREVGRRRRQAAAISAGLAVAVATVIVVSAVGAGLKTAQGAALASLYGVGTGLTVTRPVAQGSTSPQFSFGSGGSGASANGSTKLAQSQVLVARGLGAHPATDLARVSAVPGVSSADGVLMLDNFDFSGIIPSLTGQPATGDGMGADAGAAQSTTGGSSFSVDSFTVAGLRTDTRHGLLAQLKASSGRLLTAADAGHQVALVDALYAKDNQLAVGSPVNIGGIDIPVVGLVSAANGQPSIANAYLPLDVAQNLSGQPGKITTIYAKTTSAAAVGSVASAIRTALPHDHVATQADLAKTMTGTLSSASSVTASIGAWLSAGVLIAAAIIAALMTTVGVARRSRDFGTLKALGWPTRSIVAQVIGESFVQGICGAAAGVLLAGMAVLGVNAFAPQLTATVAATGAGTQIPLTLTLPPAEAAAAVALAIAAAIVAGAAGALRVSRLRPADALRSDQ